MPDFCVCVPARNEATALPILLRALADQTVAGPVPIALCVNNSDDDTALIARATAAELAPTIDVTIEIRDFPSPFAHAGAARRAAMALGMTLLTQDEDVLISTDADCRPPPTWIESILARMTRDTIVGGRILLDEAEPLAPGIVALRKRFDRYWERVRAIEDDVDPVAWDPPPRHGDHSGASLALTCGLYRRAGGVPPIATREDLGLVQAAIGAGGKLVHPEAVWTRTSARTVGRAEGGMAIDMQRWTDELQRGATPMVPAFSHWRRRAAWRREMRAALRKGETLSDLEWRLDPLPCDMTLPEVI